MVKPRLVKVLLAGACAMFCVSSANAQSFYDEWARDCGTRAANYCWENDGDTFPTMEDCVEALTAQWCPPPAEGTPPPGSWTPRDWSFFRLYELENYCDWQSYC